MPWGRASDYLFFFSNFELKSQNSEFTVCILIFHVFTVTYLRGLSQTCRVQTGGAEVKSASNRPLIGCIPPSLSLSDERTRASLTYSDPRHGLKVDHAPASIKPPAVSELRTHSRFGAHANFPECLSPLEPLGGKPEHKHLTAASL